jgi:hypothetical protein
METCVIKVTNINYNVSLQTNNISTILDGAQSRFRASLSSKSKLANVTWYVNSADFDYLIAFYYLTIGLAFNVNLIDELGIITNRICRIYPNSFNFSVKSASYEVKCILEILQ